MSRDPHIISQVSFDLGFFSAEKNHELQERVSRLFHTEISRQIDLLFSEAIAGDEILQIKQLTLDLGEINDDDLEKDLPERILASLKEKIAAFKIESPKESGNYKLVDSISYKLNAIEHYLLSGNLLHKHRDGDSGIEHYLVDLLKENASLLIKLLKRTGKKENARIRIAYQFGEKTIVNIINTLEPAYKQVITNYTDELELAENPVNSIQAQAEDFKRARYFFALTYLLVEKGSVFNTRNFVRSLLKQLSAHYNMAYQDFLWTIARQIRQSPGIFSKGLKVYIREIFMEDFELTPAVQQAPYYDDLPAVVSGPQPGPDDNHLECLFFFLENGRLLIHSGNTSQDQLQHLFLSLIREKPQQIKDFIRVKKSEKTIRNMVRFFPDKVIYECIGLYAPSHTAWILSLTGTLEKPGYLGAFFESKALLKETLFIAVLSSLLQEQENTFDKAVFTEQVLLRLSTFTRLSLNRLKAQLRSGFEKNGETAYKQQVAAGVEETDEQNREETHSPEQHHQDASILLPEQMEAQIAEMQPAQSQWILSLNDLLLKAQSYYALSRATHLSSAKKEIRHAIYDTVLGYRNVIFDRADFFNRVLLLLADRSATQAHEFMMLAKPAIAKAGGETYSRLIDPDAYAIQPQQATEKKEPDDLLPEQAIINRIRSLQPEQARWILSLHQVISRAHVLSPFTTALHKNTLQSDLYTLLLSVTEQYQQRVFDQRDFFRQVLILISARSALDTNTFLAEAEKAIRASSGRTHSDLFHNKPVAESPGEKLTERQELDGLLYFLANGQMPWWLGIDSRPLPKALWKEHFIIKKKKRLVSFLKNNVAKERVRKNLLFFLEEDLWNNTLILGNWKDEQAFLNKLIPGIRRTLNAAHRKAFIEAYLIYSFQLKEKSKGLIWGDIKTLFTAGRINLPGFYTELLKLQVLFTDTYLHPFFLLFHTNLSALPAREKTDPVPPDGEDDLSSSSPIQNKPEYSNRRETDPVEEGLIPALPESPDTVALTEQQTEKQTRRYLEALLHFLNTGSMPDAIGLTSKQLILNTIAGLHRLRNHPNTRLLYLGLKNELLLKRFMSPFDAREQEKLMADMFGEEYTFLEPYLKDFISLLSNTQLKRQMDKDPALLTSATFMFLVTYFRKPTAISTYLRFVAQRIFQSAREYQTFLALTKLAVLRKEVPLRTVLPSLLVAMMRQEKKKEDKREKPADELKQDLVYIENAGLILLWPFLGFYFEKLGLVNDRAFTSKKAAIRAACLLQYLVSGEETRQEHAFPLNKILCQLPKNHPVYMTEAFTPEETALSNELLRTAISRWVIIKNTSIEGLRNSFLKREGRLEWQDEKIILTVEPKSFDMLVDKIPWNISVIKLPWMKDTLHVKWR